MANDAEGSIRFAKLAQSHAQPCYSESALKRRRIILWLSMLLNAVLLAVLAGREISFRHQASLWDAQAPAWARYAGTMQAIADYGNGVRRIYRPTLPNDLPARGPFTGQVDQGCEVWAWIYYEELGEASRSSAVAFTDAYNKRMRNCIKDPELCDRNRAAATQPAD